MRYWKTAMFAASLALVIGTAAYADNKYQGFDIVNVVVNGKTVNSDVPAVNFYGRTMLPIRAVAEAVGMDVTWDGATNTATLTSKIPGALGDAGAPPFTFTGKSDGTSQVMSLSVGMWLVKSEYKGDGNFAIQVYDTQGKYIGLPANTIGSYSGSQVVQIRSDGRYVLNVTAEGTWTITVTPVR